MTDKPSIALLGTGIMGGHMARRLAEAGYPVTVWNRSADKAAPLAQYGIAIANTPSEALSKVAVAIVMLSTGPVCSDVLFEPDATGRIPVATIPAGGTLVVMSSIPVDIAREQSERAARHNIAYVDAPVSGGEVGARDGTLTIMAGGPADAIAALGDIFAVMGRVTRIGDAGAGSLAKLCNQVIVGNTIAAIAEALLLAKTGGADPAAVREALMGGFADSRILRLHGERMLTGNWKPGGAAAMQLKDLRTATGFAASVGLDLPVTRLVETLYQDMVEHGDAGLDHSALYLELARRNRLP